MSAEKKVAKASEVQKNLPTGEMFRKARVKKRKTIAQVSKKLRIKEIYIQAIEEVDLKSLPPQKSYVLGFVRSYATFLGLDAGETVGTFKDKHLGSVEKLDLVPPTVPQSINSEQGPSSSFLTLSLCIAFTLILSAYLQSANTLQPTLDFVAESLARLV